MQSLLAITVIDQHASSSSPDILIHDCLPVFALAAGLMALIWIACVVIAICGYIIGALFVYGVCALVHGCLRYVRRWRDVEYARLVTVGADGAHAKVVNLDRYRQQQRSHGVQSNRTLGHRSDDDPA